MPIQANNLILYSDINNLKNNIYNLFIPYNNNLSFIPNIVYNVNSNRTFTMKKYPIFGVIGFMTQTFDNGTPPSSSIYSNFLNQLTNQFWIPQRSMPMFFEYNIMRENLTIIFIYDFWTTFNSTVNVEFFLGYNDGWCYVHTEDINNNFSLAYSRQYQYNPNVYITLNNIKRLFLTITNNGGTWGLVQQINIKNINY